MNFPIISHRPSSAFLRHAILACTAMWACQSASAEGYNIAPEATVTATSQTKGAEARNVADGIIRIDGRGEWISDVKEQFWGEADYPSLRMEWPQEVTINKVILYDRPTEASHTAGVMLRFSDGSRIDVGEIPDNGAPRTVTFDPVRTRSLEIKITDADGHHPGLSEVEVFPAPESYTDYVSYVEPMVETTRGRYFYFITGCQPLGMIGAAPLTRNKNQGGGGYNYNDSHILGFPQIHAWMMSGLEFMPSSAGVHPEAGRDGWKSSFSHDGEIMQPGYHRVYLEDHGVWVEQTATDRTSCYRLTYTADTEARMLFNLGGFVGTSTMVNADVRMNPEGTMEGSFDTVGRLWGGPDSVRVYFVAEIDRPVTFDTWDNGHVSKGVSSLRSNHRSIPRNEWMSYHDAPSAGVDARCPVKAGDAVLVKMAISYVSIDNARQNLLAESADAGFDELRSRSQAEWNRWFSRIDVKGGTDNQRRKFYTDMWHTLLGRHKIDDANGQFPDRTRGGELDWKWVKNPDYAIGQVPDGSDGKGKLFHMYNSDALWLTQWNQNTLWGIAYPALLDDFSASMLQYAELGRLLPRGPCGGSYSYIMSGCPATSMITSAYQRGICRKFDPAKAFTAMKRNHLKGGMLGKNDEEAFDFYATHGYAPGRAGLTVQWAFEDWALAQMATKMGRRKDASMLMKRTRGWRQCIHPDLKLLLPKNADGSWLHTDPLNGWGYEEANAWQTTFGLSHDLPGLAEAMGGADTLCSMLDHAMRQSVDLDFVEGYGNGYVSYANQPGLSTAHVFAHAGAPWLTQYWVRQVKERAYGAVSPSRGYGGHDEDQGQMSGVSALMAIGLFSINGGSAIDPAYDITSPVFDRVDIALDPDYYPGGKFTIVTHNNSAENCYIQRATLDGEEYPYFHLPHSRLAQGGTLELWLGPEPNRSWGIPLR